MTKAYAVVTFTQDGDVEDEIVSEVPSSWLRSNATQCWWPSVKNINSFILKQTLPDKDDSKWALYPVEFHGYYDMLEQARAKSTNYSSCDDGNILHQTKRNVRISSKSQREKTPANSDSESDPESRFTLPNPPTLTMTKMPVTKPASTPKPVQSIEEVVDLQVIEGSIVSHKSVQDLHTLMTSMSTSMEDHFNRIYEVLTSLSQTVKELKTGLLAVEIKINKTRDPPALDVTNMERSFPLQTIDDVKAFEKNLTENVEEYNKFVNYCKQLRGR
ncbi:PREDICTED: uncharacterized protein LOC105556217 [Vollenhovia emeryi]|uniref:uncharacterized protein LOC105556217 n=1 Tax=Vollenhovia emeryi TaxID=411798 RepID=UPI0005F4D41D|nr:PREDICTED: uncharacterized protein LOC105556217 [Vollenhovia emeryi]